MKKSFVMSKGLGHLILGTCIVLGGGAVIGAAQAADDASPQAVYQREVSRCSSGMSGQDRATCLREAAAARDEARRNQSLDHVDQAQLQKNRVHRCDRLPESQRRDCMTQMTDNAATTKRGSVSGGGVLRETVIPVPPGTPGAAPMSSPRSLPPASTPSSLQPPVVPLH